MSEESRDKTGLDRIIEDYERELELLREWSGVLYTMFPGGNSVALSEAIRAHGGLIAEWEWKIIQTQLVKDRESDLNRE